MNKIFLNENVIPNQFTILLEETTEDYQNERYHQINDKSYYLLGLAEHKLSYINRLLNIIKIPFAYIEGLYTRSHSYQNNWDLFWNGKQIVNLYGTFDLLKSIVDPAVLEETNVEHKIYPTAISTLGYAFEKGKGVKSSNKISKIYYLFMARHFSITNKSPDYLAYSRLGVWYYDGIEFDKIYPKASNFLKYVEENSKNESLKREAKEYLSYIHRDMFNQCRKFSIIQKYNLEL